MKKIKAFFYILTKSATSPAYYRDVVTTSLGFSIKYFLMLALVISLISGIISLVITLPKINQTFGNITEDVKNLYPRDLVVKVQDGQMSINQPEPYFIKFPGSEEFNSDLVKTDETEKAEMPENLLVFDAAGTLDSLDTYKTLILINKTNILTKNPNSEKIEAYPLKDLPNGEFSKDTFAKLMDKLQVFVRLIPYLYFAIISVFLFLYNFVYRFLYALIVGVMLWILGAMLNTQLTYTKNLKIALHALTLPMIIETIKDFVAPVLLELSKGQINIDEVRIPWFFAMCIIIGLLALRAIGRGNTQPVVLEQIKADQPKLEQSSTSQSGSNQPTTEKPVTDQPKSETNPVDTTKNL